jgi:hypothetical protein
MIKKIILALVIFCTMISCGKKGDPQYTESKQKDRLQNIFINKI